MTRGVLIGIIGAILLIWGIASICVKINNPKCQEKDENSLLFPFGIAIVGFLMFGLI